jgi:glycosyltransferase involved in cell wall biosynthesis
MDSTAASLSAYIICKNEGKWIEGCIRSCARFDEIVVVDSGSTDGTLEIIGQLMREGMPIRLFERGWPGYAKQRQYAINQCSGDWIVGIDADEQLDPELAAAIISSTRDTPHNAFLVRFKPHIYGHGYAPEGVRDKYHMRVFRRGQVQYDENSLVHEIPRVEGTSGRIQTGYLLHCRSLPITDLIAKSAGYSELKASQMMAAGKRPRLLRLLFNPLIYFVKMYVMRRFFLCGWAGFIHSVSFAVYSFMTEARLHEMHAQAAMVATAGAPGSDTAIPAKAVVQESGG